MPQNVTMTDSRLTEISAGGKAGDSWLVPQHGDAAAESHPAFPRGR